MVLVLRVGVVGVRRLRQQEVEAVRVVGRAVLEHGQVQVDLADVRLRAGRK